MRLLRVIGGQQARAQVGLADPPTGIDAGAEHEAQVIARRCPVEPRHIAQRHQALAVAPRHDGQPLPHEGAVHAPERRHIGHRRQRHEVEHRHEVGPAPRRRAGGG
jgi:hypothetical protein